MSKSEKKQKAPKSNRELKRERDRRIAKGTSAPIVSRSKTRTVFGIVIAGVSLFCGATAGLTSNIQITGPVGENFLSIAGIIGQPQQAAPAAPATEVVAPVTQAPSTAPAQENTTTAPAQESTTAAPANENTTQPANDTPSASGGELSASSSKEEIIEYFNTASNKVKTEATKVTRVYEDLKAQNEYLVVPDSLKAIGEFAMNTFLKRTDEPVEYNGAAEIKDNYPVRTQDYVSKITPDLVASATVTDNGDTYEITLTFINDETNINPVFGVGYGTAFNLMLEEQVVLDYPGLSISNIKIQYHDGIIKATVDKATGRVVESTYTMPMILGLTAKILFSELDAQIGMCFEHNYTVAY
ncbi:MAG: hypothetical protein MJ177_03800 [Clostridia bacterium]|nr:hypothetical protein [Clostridia bacterium]